MKKRVDIKTRKEIQCPELLRGALESMGFLVEISEDGNGNDKGDGQFDLKIEDDKGHKIRGINIRKRLESR
jgi:hypothetical protein